MQKKSVYILVYLLPLIYGMLYIFVFGTNLIIGDDWNFLDDWFRYKETGDLWTTLWAPLFGHIEVLPKMVQYATLPLCHWNVKIVMYEMQLFVFWAYFFFAKRAEYQCIKTTALEDNKMPISFVMCSLGLALVCYSAVHWENFSWAVNIGIIMCIAFSVGCFYMFDLYCNTHKIKYLLVSYALMLAANLCHGTGFAIGVVYIGMLGVEFLVDRTYKNKENYMSYIGAIVVFAVCIFIYRETLGGGTNFTESISYYISYYFVLSGNIFAPGYEFMTPYMYIYAGVIGFIFNILSLAVLIKMIRKNEIKKYRFEFLIMAFSVALRLMILAQRSGIGYVSALYSHYAFYTVLNIASLILIMTKEGVGISSFFSTSKNQKKQEKAHVSGWMRISYWIVILAFLFYSIACIYVSYGSKVSRMEKTQLMLNYDKVDREELRILGLFVDGDDAFAQIQRADKYGLSAFHNKDN